MADAKPRPQWISPQYKGELRIHAALLKNKHNASVGLLFSKFVKRYFVLDLEKCTFGYYSDESCRSGSCIYPLKVLLPMVTSCRKYPKCIPIS